MASSVLTIKDNKTHKTIIEIPVSSTVGLRTLDVYYLLNNIASPNKVLLHSSTAKGNDIYHRIRISGGIYYLTLVPYYPEDMDPITMTQNKAKFKKVKRANRAHDINVLVNLVGKALYDVSPQTFMELARQVTASRQRGEFWGGVPQTELQMHELVRYLDSNGPEYTPPPLPLKVPLTMVTEAKSNIQSLSNP